MYLKDGRGGGGGLAQQEVDAQLVEELVVVLGRDPVVLANVLVRHLGGSCEVNVGRPNVQLSTLPLSSAPEGLRAGAPFAGMGRLINIE